MGTGTPSPGGTGARGRELSQTSGEIRNPERNGGLGRNSGYGGFGEALGHRRGQPEP